MPQYVIGYVVGAYASMDVLPLNVPGPIRRIVSGFYIDSPLGVAGPPVPLTPVATADADDEVQISDPTTPAGKSAVQIFIAAGLTNPVIYLFVETELAIPGTPHAIAA